MNKEMTKKLVVGVLRGPVEFWCNGNRTFPENGEVSCTSVRLPQVFISEEMNKNGTPVFTGYAETKFVDATQFANAISKLNNNEGGDVEIPVVMEGYTSMTTKNHTYKKWVFAVMNGTPLLAWDEIKIIPKRTSEGLNEKILARFAEPSKGEKGFPTVVPVAWAPRNANKAQVAEVSDR